MAQRGRVCEQDFEGAEGDYRQLLGVFFAAVAVAVFIFLLGVLVGQGHGPASVVPERVAAGERQAPRPMPEAVPEATPAVPVAIEEMPAGASTPTPRKRTTTRGSTATAPPRGRPATPPTREAPAPELSLDGRFAVQLLAVSDRSRAQSERFRIKQLGYSAYVVAGTDDDLHRVRVGNYKARSAAVEARDRLRRQGFPSAWILELGGTRP